MKTNITLKMDARIIRQAKLLAAREGTSVSRLLAQLLEQRIRQEKGYERAMSRALARLEEGYELGWTPPSSRDELHER